MAGIERLPDVLFDGKVLTLGAAIAVPLGIISQNNI